MAKKSFGAHISMYDKIDVARRLIEQGARTGVVTDLTDLPVLLVRQLYASITNSAPVPGSFVISSNFYFKSVAHSINSSLFASAFRQVRLAAGDDAAVAEVFLQSFRLYMSAASAVEGLPHVMDINRIYTLFRLIKSGREITTTSCKQCGSLHLSHIQYPGTSQCPLCRLIDAAYCSCCSQPLNSRTNLFSLEESRLCSNCTPSDRRKAQISRKKRTSGVKYRSSAPAYC